MPSRRRFLRAAPAAGAALLAGCSVSMGEDTTYARWIPEPDAFEKFPIDRTGRFDAGRLRERTELFHGGCLDSPLGCTIRENDIVYDTGQFLTPEEIDQVAYGGRHGINTYPRSWASLLGASAFKIYDYDVDDGTVESRLGERLSPTGTAGEFTYYGQDAGTVQAADDGERLVLGLDPAVRTVVGRMRGQGEPFEDVRSDRRLAREHLGSTATEFVMSAPAADDAPSWHAGRTTLAGGAAFDEDGVTYRSVMIFAGDAVPSSVDDAAVRRWAARNFPPAIVRDHLEVAELRIDRRDRALVVTGRTGKYGGLY